MSQIFKVKPENLLTSAYVGSNPKLIDYLSRNQTRVITTSYNSIQNLIKEDSYEDSVGVSGEDMRFMTVQIDESGNCKMVLLYNETGKRGSYVSNYCYLLEEDLREVLGKI